MTHDGATEEALARVAEEDDLPTRAGKPVEPTEAAHAWQVEDSAPEVVLPEEDEEGDEEGDEEETRSWSETFKAIAKYGGMAALVAAVGLMFLDDHLPRHFHPPVAVHQTPVANVPPPPANSDGGGANAIPSFAPVFPTVTGTVLPPTTEDSPPPVTVTETVPAPRQAGLANVNAETTARFHALLKQDGLHSNSSGPELAQDAQQICEDGANHNVGPDIAATQQRNNMPNDAAGRMVFDVLDAFCPQYGDNPNKSTLHDVQTE